MTLLESFNPVTGPNYKKKEKRHKGLYTMPFKKKKKEIFIQSP